MWNSATAASKWHEQRFTKVVLMLLQLHALLQASAAALQGNCQ
jgi:hypothetical protein